MSEIPFFNETCALLRGVSHNEGDSYRNRKPFHDIHGSCEPFVDADLSISSSVTDNGARGDGINTYNNIVDNSDDENFLSRKVFRMDGLEVYAIVGALNVASCIASLDAYGDININRDVYTLFFDHTFAVANAIATLSGLHATFIFSIVTMYGRTAIGLDKDSSYKDFMEGTQSQRHRAFQCFSVSLYASLVQCVLLIINRMVPERKFLVLAVMCILITVTISEAHDVIAEGGMIYCPKHLTRVENKSFSAVMITRLSSFKLSGLDAKCNTNKHDVDEVLDTEQRI